MSLTSNVFTLSNVTATKIVDTWNTPQRVTLHNMTKSSNEYVHYGPSTVTTTNSIHIDPGETVNLLVAPGDTLWAVSDPNGLEVGVFVSRN
jgi:LysM repeat protein